MSDLAALAVFCGLLAAVFWGVGDYAAAKASKRFGGMATAVLVNAIGAVVIDVVYMTAFREHTVFDMAGWALALSGGVAFIVANVSFYKGLEYGPVSIVSPLGSMYPVVTAIGAVVLFGLGLSMRQVVGVTIVMLGIVAAAGLFERVQHGRRFSRGPLLGLVAAVSWGLAWLFLDRAIGRLGWQLTAAVELTGASLILLPLLPLMRRSEPKLIKRLWPGLRNPSVWVAGLLITGGFLALSIGVERAGDLSTTAVVVSACYPLITVVLALRNLKETIRPVPLAGALAGIAGIVVLALG